MSDPLPYSKNVEKFVRSAKTFSLFLLLVTLSARNRTSGFVLVFQLLVTDLASVVVGLFQLHNLTIGFQFMACATFLDFLTFLPNVFAIFVFMMTIGAFKSFVLGVRKKDRALLEFLKDVSRVNTYVSFGDLVGSNSHSSEQDG
jgi:hypothetical protein